MPSNFENFKSIVANPLKFRIFLLKRLPMAFFAGLKVKNLEIEKAEVLVKYKWVNQNPFRSIYFAVLSMAAELSTGVLCFGNMYQRKPSVSMLVVNMKSSFYKKAVGKIVFVCDDGMKIKQAFDNTYATGEGQIIECTSKGFNKNNELVAEFVFTWSVKTKSEK